MRKVGRQWLYNCESLEIVNFNGLPQLEILYNIITDNYRKQYEEEDEEEEYYRDMQKKRKLN